MLSLALIRAVVFVFSIFFSLPTTWRCQVVCRNPCLDLNRGHCPHNKSWSQNPTSATVVCQGMPYVCSRICIMDHVSVRKITGQTMRCWYSPGVV